MYSAFYAALRKSDMEWQTVLFGGRSEQKSGRDAADNILLSPQPHHIFAVPFVLWGWEWMKTLVLPLLGSTTWRQQRRHLWSQPRAVFGNFHCNFSSRNSHFHFFCLIFPSFACLGLSWLHIPREKFWRHSSYLHALHRTAHKGAQFRWLAL